MSWFSNLSRPIGYLLRDLIVWGLGSAGWISRGYEVRLPELSYATPETLNSLQDTLRIVLRAIAPLERLQFHVRCDGDFHGQFTSYAVDTSKVSNAWVKRVREERLQRYTALSQQGKLRRLRLFIFRSRKVALPIRGWSYARLERDLDETLAQQSAEFADWARGTGDLLRPFGIELCPLTDADHFRLLAHTFNPSLEARPEFDPLAWFDPERPLLESVWQSEAVGHRDTGFTLDGTEQAILVMSRPPQMTRPGILAPLVQPGFRNFTLTLTIEPLQIETVIRQAEESFRRVEGDLARDRRVGDEAVLEKKRLRAKALREGFLKPFHFRFVVRTWAAEPVELRSRVLAFKQAFQAMAGAQYYEPNLPTTCKQLFEQTWPGWLGSPYPHFKLYAEDAWLADLL